MKQWYVVETTPSGQTVLGPMGLEQLQELQRAGKLVASTQVCEVGADRWSRADELPELRGLFGAAIPASTWPAPATAASTTSGAGATAKSTPFGFSNAFSLAFDVFRRSWVMLLFCGLLVFAGQMIVQLAGLPLQYLTGGFNVKLDGAGNVERVGPEFDPSQLPLLLGAFLLVMVATVLLGFPLSAAQTWIGVRAVRGKLEIEDVVQPFRRYFAVVGTGILTLLIVVSVMVPGGLAIGVGAAVASDARDGEQALLGALLVLFGALLLALPTIYVNTRLYFALTVACDPEQGAAGPFESIQRSWAMTRGRFWVTFGYFLCLALLVVATLLLFCVGLLIVGMPLLSAGFGAYYELARRDPPGTQS